MGHRTKQHILLFIKGLGLGGAERLLVDSLPFWDQQRFHYHVAYMAPWKQTLAPYFTEAGVPLHCLGELTPLHGAGQPKSQNGEQSVGNLPVGNQTQRDNQQAAGAQAVTPAHSWQAAAMTPLVYQRLRRLIRQEAIDLIHADMPVPGILARAAGRQLGVPVVYTEHNVLERYHPLTRWVHRATFGWQACVLTVSDEVQASIRRAGGDHKTHVRTLLNGVPVEQVQREAFDLAALRAELAIPPHHTVVGSVAVFRTQKRLADWIAVAAQVAAVRADVTFLLVGDGPEMPQVQAQIQALGLQNRVRLPGFRPDGRRYLGLLDIYQMTSQFEGLPIALLEAMALGKPVVATAVGGIPEVLTHGVEGYCTMVGALDQLARYVTELVEQPERRQQMGARGAAKITAHYHIKHRVRTIEAIYAELLANGAQVQQDQISK